MRANASSLGGLPCANGVEIWLRGNSRAAELRISSLCEA
jgi:hypothetical protein